MSKYSLSDGVLVCDHVVKQERRVTLVVHHADGMWSFWCGEYDHDSKNDDVGVAHVEHIIEDQPEIEVVMTTLQPGFLSEFQNGEWQVAAHDD